MFRSFAIIIEIILLIVVLRSSFVQYLIGDIQRELSNWMTEISQIAEQKQLESLQQTLKPQISIMRPYQKVYIDEIFASKASLKHFYSLYCLKDDRNPHIFGTTRTIFCKEIGKTDLIQG
jgi:predicted PurR-regulated permease PerM